VELKPYTYDELLAALNAVAPYDWRTHFNERLASLSPRAPVGGLTEHGWKVVYNDTPNDAIAASEQRRKLQDLTYSLGLTIKTEAQDAGTIRDAWLGQPAGNAGIGPGMKIIAVNGRRYTREVMTRALREKAPLELIVQNNEEFRTYRLDYTGGVRYPHLIRDEAHADTLAEVLKARR
jgi:predicted metalloprotease with PDZ domain